MRKKEVEKTDRVTYQSYKGINEKIKLCNELENDSNKAEPKDDFSDLDALNTLLKVLGPLPSIPKGI